MLTLPTAHIFFENIAMLHFKMNLFSRTLVAHAFNASTLEAEARGSL